MYATEAEQCVVKVEEDEKHEEQMKVTEIKSLLEDDKVMKKEEASDRVNIKKEKDVLSTIDKVGQMKDSLGDDGRIRAKKDSSVNDKGKDALDHKDELKQKKEQGKEETKGDADKAQEKKDFRSSDDEAKKNNGSLDDDGKANEKKYSPGDDDKVKESKDLLKAEGKTEESKNQAAGDSKVKEKGNKFSDDGKLKESENSTGNDGKAKEMKELAGAGDKVNEKKESSDSGDKSSTGGVASTVAASLTKIVPFLKPKRPLIRKKEMRVEPDPTTLATDPLAALLAASQDDRVTQMNEEFKERLLQLDENTRNGIPPYRRTDWKKAKEGPVLRARSKRGSSTALSALNDPFDYHWHKTAGGGGYRDSARERELRKEGVGLRMQRKLRQFHLQKRELQEIEARNRFDLEKQREFRDRGGGDSERSSLSRRQRSGKKSSETGIGSKTEAPAIPGPLDTSLEAVLANLDLPSFSCPNCGKSKFRTELAVRSHLFTHCSHARRRTESNYGSSAPSSIQGSPLRYEASLKSLKPRARRLAGLSGSSQQPGSVASDLEFEADEESDASCYGDKDLSSEEEIELEEDEEEEEETPEEVTAKGQLLVGKTCHVSVNGHWKKAAILNFRARNKRHLVEFNDGRVEWVLLNNQNIRLDAPEKSVWSPETEAKLFPCKYCGKMMKAQALGGHTKMCKYKEDDYQEEQEQEDEVCAAPAKAFPCKYCGRAFSRHALGGHTKVCKMLHGGRRACLVRIQFVRSTSGTQLGYIRDGPLGPKSYSDQEASGSEEVKEEYNQKEGEEGDHAVNLLLDLKHRGNEEGSEAQEENPDLLILKKRKRESMNGANPLLDKLVKEVEQNLPDEKKKSPEAMQLTLKVQTPIPSSKHGSELHNTRSSSRRESMDIQDLPSSIKTEEDEEVLQRTRQRTRLSSGNFEGTAVQESTPEKVPCEYCSKLLDARHMSKHWRFCTAKQEAEKHGEVDMKEEDVDGSERVPCALCSKEIQRRYMNYHSRFCRGVPGTPKSIQQHQKEEEEQQEKVPCKYCSKPFFQRHMSKHLRFCSEYEKAQKEEPSEGEKIPCEYCSRPFLPRRMGTHLRFCSEYQKQQQKEAEDPEKVPCEYCSKEFISNRMSTHLRFCAEYQASLNKNPDDDKIPCEYCSRLFHKQRMNTHLRFCQEYLDSKQEEEEEKVEEGRIPCEYCSKPFVKRYMNTHLRFCQQYQATKEQQEQEKEVVEKKMPCEYCSRPFAKRRMSTHLRFCQEYHATLEQPKSEAPVEEKIPCEYCSKPFYKRRLNTHLRFCSEFQNQQEQEEEPSEEETIPCDYCSRPFHKHRMNTHLRFCSEFQSQQKLETESPEEEKVPCEYCSKPFHQRRMNTHLRFCSEYQNQQKPKSEPTEEEKIPCEYCSKPFHKRRMNTHLRFCSEYQNRQQEDGEDNKEESTNIDAKGQQSDSDDKDDAEIASLEEEKSMDQPNTRRSSRIDSSTSFSSSKDDKSEKKSKNLRSSTGSDISSTGPQEKDPMLKPVKSKSPTTEEIMDQNMPVFEILPTKDRTKSPFTRFGVGCVVEADFQGKGVFYPARVVKAYDRNYMVLYDDNELEDQVPPSLVRLNSGTYTCHICGQRKGSKLAVRWHMRKGCPSKLGKFLNPAKAHKAQMNRRDSAKCGECKKDMKAPKKAMVCNGCNSVYHNECRLYTKTTKGGWFCTSCLPVDYGMSGGKDSSDSSSKGKKREATDDKKDSSKSVKKARSK